MITWSPKLSLSSMLVSAISLSVSTLISLLSAVTIMFSVIVVPVIFIISTSNLNSSSTNNLFKYVWVELSINFKMFLIVIFVPL